MSGLFHAIERIRNIVLDPFDPARRGIQGRAIVNLDDLSEILEDWQRMDNKLRALHEARPSTPPSDNGQGLREALDLLGIIGRLFGEGDLLAETPLALQVLKQRLPEVVEVVFAALSGSIESQGDDNEG